MRCPRCGKRFKSNMGVLAHMNQPKGSCNTYLNEMVRIDAINNQAGLSREAQQDPVPVASPTMEEEDSMFNHYVAEEGDMLIDDLQHSAEYTEEYPGAATVYAMGTNFMDRFDAHVHADRREDNVYYPFASRDEWHLASYLLRSNLSMSAIDELLSLQMVRGLRLSFCTAKELRSRAEMLPQGPQWKCKSWKPAHATKNEIKLFYRDSLECVESLVSCPLMKDHLHFTPMRVFQTAEKLMRVYGEWRTADSAWNMQDRLPPGATLLGTILSSDKTNISVMTGNRIAHPLLLSLANLDMDFRMKGSHHAFLLLALLPIPKFLHKSKRICGVLESRLIHECLDFVTRPLKKAAEIGVMMSDSLGYRRYCFTPLAAFIVDTPEAAMLSCVAGKTSPFTMASYKQFGDCFRHEARTGSTTLAQLRAVKSNADPLDLKNYFKEAQKFRLNGVHRPFWRDWALSDPSIFLMPEPLHHLHKQFWDHDAKWCIRVVGNEEIDFRFSILHPHIGFRHFKEGISNLKQVTGREHRDVQRYLVGVIAGAVPKAFLIAIRALMDFRYLSQARRVDENICKKIKAALQEFHDHKAAILDAGARVGKGNRALGNWHIPKLEFMQSMVPSIRANGAIIQFSADTTEHAHITEIKNPARRGNNQNYEAQICRYLDRNDKCRRFDLATSVRAAQVEFRGHGIGAVSAMEDDNDSDPDDVDVGSTTSLLARIKHFSTLSGRTRVSRDFFQEAESLLLDDAPQMPRPLRTFVGNGSALHLARDPSFKRMLVDDVAQKYGLPDLRASLADYLQSFSRGDTTHNIGRRRMAQAGCTLPFDSLEVWSKVRIQTKACHGSHEPLPPHSINALPPSKKWPLGRYDAVIINTMPDMQWPFSGHRIGQVRLIMHVVPRARMPPTPGTEIFLAYVQRFDIVPQVNPSGSATIKGQFPDPVTGMYVLKRAMRADNSRMGAVIALSQLRDLVHLCPRLGAKADPRLTKETSFEYNSEFLLNKYFHKELFYALNE